MTRTNTDETRIITMLSATSTVEVPTCALYTGAQAIVNAAEAYHRWPASATTSPASFCLRPVSFCDRGDAWQFRPFEQFERGAATGGDVADLIGQSGLLDRGDGISAPND